MKMKFSIAYAAKWGHALHVELAFAAADGYQDTMVNYDSILEAINLASAFFIGQQWN